MKKRLVSMVTLIIYALGIMIFNIPATASDNHDLPVFSGTNYIDDDFSDGVLEITNDDFVPGDINADGDVNGDDKEECEQIIADGDYIESADFNRDGKVDKYDLKIFDDVDSKPKVPEKPKAPVLSDKVVTFEKHRVTATWHYFVLFYG